MILLKIELYNLRTHSHFVFEPALKGTTAIVGGNGTGKSTIVDSLGWALYGTRVHGLRSKYYIKEGIDPKVKPVSATVTLANGNMEYKVDRRIVSETGSMLLDVYSRPLNSEDEWQHESGPSVSHAETFIRQMLGLDEKGFYSSVFVQQKQVDQIVFASAKERAAVIEKLTGINSITESIALVKENIKLLQASANVLQVGSLEEEQNKVEQQLEVTQELAEKFKHAKEVMTKKQVEYEYFTKTFAEQEQRQNQAKDLQHQQSILLAEMKQSQEELSRYAEMLSQSQVDKQLTKESKESLQKRLSELQQVILSTRSQKEETQTQLTLLDDLFKRTIQSSCVKELEQCVTQREERATLLSQLESRKSFLKEKAELITEYLEALKSGVAHCPMCNHEVEDIQEEQSKHQADLKNIKQEVKAGNQQIKELKVEIADLMTKEIDLSQIVQVYQEQQSQVQKYNNLKVEIDTLKTTLELQEKQSQSLINLIHEVEKQEEAIKSTEIVKNSILTINNRLQKKSEQHKELEKQRLALNPLSDKEYKALVSEIEKKRSQLEKGNVAITKMEYNLRIAHERLKNAQLSYSKLEKAVKEHQQVTTQLNQQNLVLMNLQDFKLARIAEAVPAISSIASEILSKFTNGDLIELILSDNFETSVKTRNGYVRPVSQLSGGEVSSAAIALRLAIAIFLHKGAHSLLILDEVLVSMSKEWAIIILETIKELIDGQIILISHSTVVDDFTDKQIETQ